MFPLKKSLDAHINKAELHALLEADFPRWEGLKFYVVKLLLYEEVVLCRGREVGVRGNTRQEMGIIRRSSFLSSPT